MASEEPNMNDDTDTATRAEPNKSKAKEPELKTVNYRQLFRYARGPDYLLLGCAALAAMLHAFVFPVAIIGYSELVAMFIDRSLGIGTSSGTTALPLFGGGKQLTNATYEENMDELRKDSVAFGIIMTIDSLVMLFSGMAFVNIFNHLALELTVRMRREFFRATIRQEIGWHDMSKDQNFAVRITDNMEKIRTGIAENAGHFLTIIFDVAISVIISLAYGWKLALAMFFYIPLTIVVNAMIAHYQSKLTAREQSSYVRASSVVEEVIGAIRTVVAFGGERSESVRYENLLKPALTAGKWKGAFSGLSDTVMKAMMFIVGAGAFWYGANLILHDRATDIPSEEREYTPAIVMIVISGIIVGANHLSRTSPFLETFAMARGSASAIYDVIDRVSVIDPLSKAGKILNYGLKGSIEFRDVFFQYPARKDITVLRGLNLIVKEGQTVALVGSSGCGKSTCVQLLQRFYDPVFGQVLLDGEDVRKYNINWLRSNIAVVGQEPVLFQGTIGENIRHGKPEATQREVEVAARAANAHEFITALYKGYDTHISEKGVQLSGGQRQRIAIARALIQQPTILLLDEATSALDYHSEKLVQAALDKACMGRTTLVVSHRLSAIRHADQIVYIENGKVVEQGTHEDLVKQQGYYYKMVSAYEYDDRADEVLNECEEMKSQEIEQFRRSSLKSLDKNAEFQMKRLNLNHSQAADDEEKAKCTKSISYPRTFLRVLIWARPEWSFLAIGTVCAALYGCSMPAFSVVLAELYASLAEPTDEAVLQHSSSMSIISVVIGICVGIFCFVQTFFYNLAGVWLTSRMRSKTFRSIMNQEMGWFDEKENSVGALSARLSGDAASVQGAIGFPLSNIIQALTNFICSFSIAFSYSWELALVCLSTAPFMVASIIFEARFSEKSALKEKDVLEETSRIATETIAQIRTVAALRREEELIKVYDAEVERYRLQIKSRLRWRGLVNSLGMTLMFFGYAVTLTYGGFMCAEGRIKFEVIMKIANTMLYGLFILAQSLAFTPAFNAALLSATRMHEIIDRKPLIQSPNVVENAGNGNYNYKTNVVEQGVSYRELNFAYPSRPNHSVLKDFNLDVLQGQTVALVGASGSGKSTCVQLLLRYYDPDEGKILIDQESIHQDMELKTLRRRLGIVSQEPSLFEKTIAENISYGDTSRNVPMQQIIDAAKMANAHDFIMTLPAQYETMLGSKGTQLSGGQKQRIAIARAMVRNPKILLLDEATSALDMQSERVVQQALDSACSGRTCIVIAHRLSTVQNANIICVIQVGRIIEQGTHSQLLAKNGIYAKLYRSQSKNK
ncbi:multidrug resistance protein homolog 65 [Drosophila grimshawi]|uniref:GH16283 n=1 Tax=Drosophila grimshawi TaxID=7222 RepID=B4IY57_DROGR|nr:multidrug resistance protein homolog 65 [Drosophila grimshawi]XP_032598419.1 multidrug resistance protein homolog 65 [Drosophila grimshawi]EDV96507.1 GH16283 [Drosophila grimshawi]